MQDAVQSRPRIRFGIFEADLEAGELRRNGLKLRLAGQPFQILAVLLEQPGRVVTRDELQKRLWPDTVVDIDHSLNTAINRIREALQDSAENPRFVETLPRRGYRFIAPVCTVREVHALSSDPPLVSAILASQPAQSDPASPERRTGRHRRWALSGAAIAALLIVSAIELWYTRSPLPPPRITDFVQLTNDGRARTIGGTDGTRLFVNAFAPDEITELSISDGRSAPFPMDIPIPGQCTGAVPVVRDVSPDGSRLLVLCLIEGIANLNANHVWIVGALGRPAHLLVDAQDAAWSPDGRFIVYSTTEGAIYSIPAEGGQARQVTPAVVPKGQFVLLHDLSWSPDGSSIRFTRESAIWEASSQGGTPHRLLNPQRWKAASCCGRWTPDGNFFVFIYGDSLFSDCVNQRAAQLWAIDERHKGLRKPDSAPIQLIGGPIGWADPIPSRDGTRIFARGVTIRGELARLDPRTKQLQPYLGGISALDLVFSPDGKYIAFVTFPDGALWRANRDGSNVVQLRQPSKDHAAAPCWSPDGSKIVYLAATQGAPAIFSVPSNGGPPEVLLAEQSGFYNDPSFSPDGKHIVFATVPLSGNLPLDIEKVGIRILDLDTHRISVLPNSQGLFSPRWSPDGRFIAGLAVQNSELRLYDLRLQKWLPLAKLLVSSPAWSRDSRFIYGLTFGVNAGVYRAPISGAPAQMVLNLKNVRQTGWWSAWFGLDPTDAPLILRDAGAYEIYSLRLERDLRD